MSCDGLTCPGDDGRDICIPDEQQQRGLSVAPREVAGKLIESVSNDRFYTLMVVLPVDDLAFAYEDVAVVFADENVRLAIAVKDLPSGLPLKLRVEQYQNKVSDFFLVKFGGGRWSALERVASVAKHSEDSFIVGIGQSR